MNVFVSCPICGGPCMSNIKKIRINPGVGVMCRSCSKLVTVSLKDKDDALGIPTITAFLVLFFVYFVDSVNVYIKSFVGGSIIFFVGYKHLERLPLIAFKEKK
ncbi:hypothetical protein GOV05_04095 [Candidatus Woesearchaeota archaeon]|nr:hypothetical protein [Candidatus Woesearchaeota archaeon]